MQLKSLHVRQIQSKGHSRQRARSKHAGRVAILAKYGGEQQHDGVSEDADPRDRDARNGGVLATIYDVAVKLLPEIAVRRLRFRVVMVKRQGRHGDP